MVEPIPDNYPRVSAALAVDGAADAIEFYCAVFGATVRMRIPAPELDRRVRTMFMGG